MTNSFEGAQEALELSIDGILNLDKPPGISSARAVDHVKRLLPRKTKIGHAGTLDPFATGVLVLLIGRGTKLCERLMNQPKQYEATIKLGATTATDDPESAEEAYASKGGAGGVVEVTRGSIDAALPRFIGAIQQRPPAFSAMKVGGQRAYKLARDGETVKLEARTVHVYGIDLLDFAWPLLRVRIDCGRGTYIRSIARDLGEALDVGGHLTQLRRTRVGEFGVETAVTLERLRAEGVEKHILPLNVLDDDDAGDQSRV